MKKSNLLFAIAISSLIAISGNAANDDAIINKAKELQKAKKYDDAVKLFEANTQKTASEKLYLEYATLLINLKKYKECETMLSKATEIYPNSLRLKNAFGQAKYKTGNLSGASAVFSFVLSRDRDNQYAKTMLDTIRKEKLAASSPIPTSVSSNEKFSEEEIDFESNSGMGLNFKISKQLSLEEQEKKAKEIYKKLADKDLDKYAINTYITNYKEIIEKCPDTARAQEACMRLCNLFTLGVEPAEYENAISCLEHLIKTYPTSPYIPDAKNKLISYYANIKEYDKICAIYEELFKNDPEPSKKEFMIRALDYAKALKNAGKTDEAVSWFNKVIEVDEGQNALEARAARRLLGEL